MPEPKETVVAPPAPTPAVPPAPGATPQPSETPVTPPVDNDEKITLSKKDYNNLISARDKANNNNSDTESVLSALLQKDAVRDAMATGDFKSQYPDVTEADLLAANPLNEEQIVEVAKTMQARFEKIRQDAIKNIEIARPPEITIADRDAKLKELKTSKPANAFAQALRLKSMQVRD